MLQINTFNGFSLHRSDGAPVRELPRRLAAIAVLMAHGGEQGASRERILELLWSGHDPAKARHALTQSIYSLRRAFESDDAVLGTSQLSLNPEFVRSDVGEFVVADQRGDDAVAVALYRGPFLDGFFVSGAADLEQWISLRREEFARKVAQKLERLAVAAEQAGRFAEASSHWRQRSAIDPLDASVVLNVMRVLAESGNPAAALQQGRIYEKMVAQELDLPADHRVVAYIGALAEGRITPTATQRSLVVGAGGSKASAANDASIPNIADESRAFEAAPTLQVAGATQSEAPADPATAANQHAYDVQSTPNAGVGWRASLSRRWRDVTIGTAAVLALAWGGARLIKTPMDAAQTRHAVAVLPFRATGADASLAFLREGMVDLLVHALEDGDSLGVIDAGKLMSAWRAKRGDRGELPNDSLLRFAESLGAEQAVIGAAVGTAERLILTATLVDARDGARIARASANGPVDSLPRMARRMAVQLVSQAAGEGDVALGHPTLDMPALRAYLHAREVQRRGDWRPALASYATAVRHDSTFASAALGMAIAADWLEEWPLRARALALALGHRGALSPRERAVLDGVAGARYPEPALAVEQLAAWERAAVLSPEREELWTELGRRLLHEGGVAGVPRSMERARRALTRAVALNAQSLPARRAMLTLLLAEGNRNALAQWRLENPRGTDSTRHDVSEAWRLATALDDEAALQRLRPLFDSLDDDALRRIALFGIHDAVQVADGRRAAQRRLLHVPSGEAHTDALLAQHAYAMVGGQPTEALRILHSLSEEPTARGAHLRLQVLDALYSDGDTIAGAEAARELAVRIAHAAATPEAHAIQMADLCVEQQWRAWHGDFSETERTLRSLRLPVDAHYLAPGMSNPAACATLIEAVRAVAQRAPSAAPLLAQLEATSLAGPTIGDLRHYAPIAIARLRMERGEHDAALVAVRRRLYAREWPRYLATALLLESQLSERAGDRAAARRALQRYLALRATPEAATAGAVNGARQRLLALAGD